MGEVVLVFVLVWFGLVLCFGFLWFETRSHTALADLLGRPELKTVLSPVS